LSGKNPDKVQNNIDERTEIQNHFNDKILHFNDERRYLLTFPAPLFLRSHSQKVRNRRINSINIKWIPIIFLGSYFCNMKKALDRFSHQSKAYKDHRPTYPEELFKYIYSFCNAKNTCWDCGTGNGQVAIVLSKSFAHVFASDISKQQIRHAVHRDNIEYSVQRAEQTSFVSDSFDLITVAQAVHWFDLEAFNHEVQRVLKPNGIIAIWGYGLLRINSEIDPIILHFYNNIIGAYWDKERDYIDLKYSTIPFNFNEIHIKDTFKIETSWTLLELEGYFNSWSSVQNFMKKNNGQNPVDQLIKDISLKWNTPRQKITFPIFMRLGRNAK
tara:strand:+ start:324 stop:1307 length:984 start_codon:yes stop_codon:yes gene_type:complete